MAKEEKFIIVLFLDGYIINLSSKYLNTHVHTHIYLCCLKLWSEKILIAEGHG